MGEQLNGFQWTEFVSIAGLTWSFAQFGGSGGESWSWLRGSDICDHRSLSGRR